MTERARVSRSQPASSLAQQIYGQLRKQILTCEIAPGQVISEPELASRFKVSKTPVREALATLRTEGFVRSFPRRGYEVTQVTLVDVDELLDVRILLEAAAAELACERITQMELSKLQRLAQVSYDRKRSQSLRRFVGANRQFHMIIAAASGNGRLRDLLARQLDVLERAFYLGARLRDISAEMDNEHRRIVATLRRRDRIAAREIVIEHNEATRKGLHRAIASPPRMPIAVGSDRGAVRSGVLQAGRGVV